MVQSTYEQMEIGEPFEPLEYVLTAEKVRTYREVVGDSNPIFDRVQPDGSLLVPPQIFGFDFHTVRNRHGNTHGGLHAKQSFHFQHAAKVGMRVRVDAWLADKYERRGYRYTVVAAKISDSHGLLLVEGSDAAATIKGDSPRPSARRAAPLPALGPDDPPPLTRQLVVSQMAAYWHQVCGRSEESSHSSIAVAQQSGHPTALGQGNMVLCWLEELLVQHFGERWCRDGAVQVKIIGRMFEGDTLTWYATRRHEPGQGTPKGAALDVWCQNQRGELTIIGTAQEPKAAS